MDASGSPVYALIGSDIPGLTINADGSWSFDPANVAYDDLAKDELKTISVSYSVTDDRGAVDTGTFSINLTGTNDAPEATYTTDLSVLEGASDASGNALLLSGQLSATDVDTDASGLTYTLVADASGNTVDASGNAFSIDGLNLDSDGSFTFDPTNSAYNYLSEGATERITVNYQVADDESGTSSVESFDITVLGTNDGPTATYDASGLAVTEGGSSLSGQLTSTDVDASGSPVYALIGSDIPGLTINADGSWSFDPANVAYDDLAKDELKTISVSYSVTDDRGAVDTGTFSINLTGTNDAPEATYTTDLSVLEGASDASGNALLLSGQLSATDVDTDASGLTYTLVADASGNTVDASGNAFSIDGLNLDSDGSFTFDPTNSAYNYLSDGATERITVNYQVADDESGTSSVESFDITVLGTNDGPTATYDASGLAVTEGGSALSGQLTSTDVDASGSPVYALIGSDIPGLTINADGSWSFDPANVAYDDLAKDELKTISVSYSVTDDRGAVDTGTFSINLTGTNDAPEATYTTDLSVLEGASDASGNALLLSGQLSATDVDTDASGLTYTLVADASGNTVDASGNAFSIDGLNLDSDGSFTFDPTNSAYNYLSEGATERITVNYQVADDESGTSSVESFDITVLGTNDGPTATYDASGLAVTEGGSSLSGQLTSSDVDASGSPVYALIGSDIPGLTINADGSWSFDPANVAYDDLAKDELKTISVSYSVTDDRGAVDTGTFSINLTGTNDAPEATYTTDLSVLEGASDASGNALLLSGQLSATDVDTDASGLTYTLVADASGNTVDASGNAFSIDGLNLDSDGSFTFDPTNSAYNYLSEGATERITVNYQVADDESGTSSVESFDITVLGTNDGPTATYDASGLAVTEGGSSLSGQLTSTDVDASGSPVYALIGSDIPGLTINADGSWSFDPANVAYDDLAKDELKTISVSYSVTDDRGAVDTGTFSINLTGTNDAPEATYTTDLSVLEGASDASGNALLLSGQLSATDVDTDASGLTYMLVADASGNTVDASGNAFSIDGLNLDSDGSFTFDPTNSAHTTTFQREPQNGSRSTIKLLMMNQGRPVLNRLISLFWAPMMVQQPLMTHQVWLSQKAAVR